MSTQPTCKNCGKPIKRDSTGFRWWKHEDGFYNCDGRRGHAETFAELGLATK